MNMLFKVKQLLYSLLQVHVETFLFQQLHILYKVIKHAQIFQEHWYMYHLENLIFFI